MVASQEAELEQMLSLNPRDMERDETGVFATAAGERASKVVLFGAGGLGQKIRAALRDKGVQPVAFADNSLEKQGTMIDGLVVLSPQEAASRFGSSAVFVVAIWGANSPHRFATSRKQLEDLGCTVVSFPSFCWMHHDGLLPHYLVDLPHKVLDQAADVRRGLDLWADDASRSEYVSQVRFRLHADFDGLAHPVEDSQYFPEGLYDWNFNEWIVDGGAYDGDSIRMLNQLHGDRFGHVLALEPDPTNFARLKATVAALPPAVSGKITCRQVALDARRGVLHLDALGNASSATSELARSGTIAVPAAPLDELLAGATPTMIKLDIEGAEPEALLGARQTIESSAPIIAVCVYHRQDHLWKIPRMLKEWREDYSLFLRPHNEEGWDLVCYAVPRERLTWRGE